jgi:hypothetical protein
MHRKVAMAIVALSLGGYLFLTSLPVSAQQVQQQQQDKDKGKGRSGGGNVGAPSVTHKVSPSVTRTVTPSTTLKVTPSVSHKVTSSRTRTVTPSTTLKVTPSVTHKFTARRTRTVTPSTTLKVIPKVTRKVTASKIRTVTPGVIPKVVLPSGGQTHVVTAGKLRGVPASGAGRATILGHNYSVWRSGYRVRHGSGWQTFVALRTLTAIAIGSRHYYPYAYITAPRPYCTGLTEDGCQLMWQDVETIEGDIVSQCVAYCPWQ